MVGILVSGMTGIACTEKPSVPALESKREAASEVSVAPSACVYEENCDCPSPGITSRYALSYCLAELGTDDCEAGMKCLEKLQAQHQEQLKNKSACEQNQFYHRLACEKFQAGQGDSCLKTIPNLVKTGC